MAFYFRNVSPIFRGSNELLILFSFFARLGSRLLDGREISQESFSGVEIYLTYFANGCVDIDVAQWNGNGKKKYAISLIELPKNRRSIRQSLPA